MDLARVDVTSSITLAHDRYLPVDEAFATLLPDPGLIRGRIVGCTGAGGHIAGAGARLPGHDDGLVARRGGDGADRDRSGASSWVSPSIGWCRSTPTDASRVSGPTGSPPRPTGSS